MAESEVPIVSRLKLERSQFAQELQQAKADVAQFANDAKSNVVEIPVRMRDEFSTPLRAMLQSFAGTELVIPVRYAMAGDPAGVMGGAGGWGGRMSTLMPGGGGDAVYGGGGAAAMGYGGAGRIYNTVNQTYNTINQAEAAAEESLSPYRYVPSFPIFAEAADELEAKARGTAASAAAATLPGATRGRGGMRGMRLFMAAHFAIHGAEAVYGSYQQRYGDYDNQSNDPDKNAEASIRAIEKMRSGVGGLTGVARDVFASAFSDSSFASFLRGGNDPRGITAITGYRKSDFDDEAAIRQIEKSRDDARKSEEQARIQSRASDMATGLERRVGDVRETLNIAMQPEGIQKHLAEIHKQTQLMAEGFDKEAKLLEEAADKLKGTNPTRQKLLDRAAAARSQGASIASDVERFESDAARHEDFIERQAREGTMQSHLGALSLQNDAAEAELRGDTLGASRARIMARHDQAIQEATNAYHLAHGKITEVDYERQRAGIDRQERLDMDLAEKGERARVARLRDETDELGIVSPFARAMKRVQDEAARAEDADPAHADAYRARAAAQQTDLNRKHDADLQRMRDQTQELNLRTARQEHTADVIGLNNRMTAELKEAEGDPAAQQAIRDKYRAQANAMQQQLTHPTFHTESMRNIYSGVLMAALQDDPKHTQGRDAQRAQNGLNSLLANIDRADERAQRQSQGPGTGTAHANEGDAWKKWSDLADRISNGPQVLTAA